MSLDCTGETLPFVQTIDIEPSQHLDSFCLTLEFDDEVLLYETLTSGTYYWVIFKSDEALLSVCELEKYADFLSNNDEWVGRRSDYLIIGSYYGDCYLVVVEMRHVLVKTEQEDDKFEQLKSTIETLILHQLDAIRDSNALSRVYDQPDYFKIIGAVIAPGNTRRFARGQLNPIVDIAGHKVAIRTLPKDALSDCKITWTEFLRRMGVPVN